METRKILMLCLGNICRSPLAHGLLEKKTQEAGLNWLVDSAGIGHWHIGKLPDERSVKIAASHGLDITNQRARRFEVLDFDKFDTIYAMDHKNYDTLMKIARNEADASKVKMILDEVFPGEGRSLQDPFHNGEEDFEGVYQALDVATNAILSDILLEV